MKFIDEIELTVKAGNGGNGMVAFRREKYRPRCGPSGGDGGRGGNIIFKADENIGTLVDLRYKPVVEAGSGQHGQGNDCYGKSADDVIIRVPVGTIVFDRKTNEIIGDLNTNESSLIIAKGGAGGLGNIHFATPSNRAPRQATPGEEGECKELRLELRLLADVGLVGLPSVGKSSIISKLSAAKPKIAQYPFTTLQPNLGVVKIDTDAHFVVADIPGLIENASKGAGLGIRFLKHIQRTALLVYVLALDETLENDLVADLQTLQKEINSFEEGLAKRGQIIVLNKTDLAETRAVLPQLSAAFEEKGYTVVPVSTITGEGIKELKQVLFKKLKNK